MMSRHNVKRITYSLFVMFSLCRGDAYYAAPQKCVKEEGFSYVPPPRWTVKPCPAPSVTKCKVVTGPTVSGYLLNMNAHRQVMVKGPLLHEHVVNHQIKTIQKELSNFRLLSKAKFTTNDGRVGCRVACVARDADGTDSRYLLYSFLRMQFKVTVGKYRYETVTFTCSAPTESAGKYDEVYDNSMNTFKFTLFPR